MFVSLFDILRHSWFSYIRIGIALSDAGNLCMTPPLIFSTVCFFFSCCCHGVCMICAVWESRLASGKPVLIRSIGHSRQIESYPEHGCACVWDEAALPSHHFLSQSRKSIVLVLFRSDLDRINPFCIRMCTLLFYHYHSLQLPVPASYPGHY
jgi:hypothetical protein